MRREARRYARRKINVLELYKGAYSPPRSETGLKKVKKMLEALAVLSIDEDTYEMFGELSAELKRRGEAIGDFDELIASVALTHKAPIVSTDSQFQRVPGLIVVSPEI